MIRLPALLLILFCQLNFISAQGYLHTAGQRIENEKNENVLLRGMGLGGWMLQEGYMLGINQESQQHRIRERMADVVGEKQTELFYEN